MKFLRNHIATGATVFVAIASGHVVQNADRYFGQRAVQIESAVAIKAPVARFQVQDVIPLAASASEGAPAKSADADLPAALALPGLPEEARALAKHLSTLDKDYRKPQLPRGLNQYGMPCETSLTATPVPGAMVVLSLAASCHLEERVEISQDRLHFTAKTSNTGTLDIQIPALGAAPVFIVQFADGSLETTTAQVPDAKDFTRIALQWRGDEAMHIHAYEFGARYKEPGHVWAEAPHSPETGVTGKGGFMINLGDRGIENAAQAEIYSYPRAAHPDSGLVRVNIEAEVTNSNCGREIAAETLQPGADGALQQADVTFAVPGCDAVGEFLVLKNILRDLKIARN